MVGVIMDTIELMREYVRVYDMCKGTDVKPWECVRHINEDQFDAHPRFEGKPWNYKFAFRILEGKPVFENDKIYRKDTGAEIMWDNLFPSNWDNWTWAPLTKKRTFMLNGMELPCPTNDANGCRLDFLGEDYFFTSIDDRNKVAEVISNLLTAARDKK